MVQDTEKNIKKNRRNFNEIRIRKVMGKIIDDIKQGRRPNLYKAMKELGYSEYSARAGVVVRSRIWKDLLEEIEDEPLLKRLEGIALDKKDKRASIEAIKEIFKLKDRYPKTKLTLELMNEELSKIEEDL